MQNKNDEFDYWKNLNKHEYWKKFTERWRKNRFNSKN